MSDNIDYVPAEIVKMLFDQNQKAIESNTIAIKEMTKAVTDLANFIAYPPTNKDISVQIKEHDDNLNQHIKDSCLEDEKKLKEQKDDIDTSFKEIKNSIKTMSETVDTLKSKVNTMIAIVLIAFSLATTIYVIINTVVNSNVKTTIETTMKQYNINNNGNKTHEITNVPTQTKN